MSSERSGTTARHRGSSPAAAAIGEYGAQSGAPGKLAESIGGSPRVAAQRVMSAQIQDSPYMTAQRARLSGAFGGGTTLQRVIDTDVDDVDEWEYLEDGEMPDNGFGGLPPTASKTVDAISATTAPADPEGMGTWRAKGYLRDPAKSNGQALTRMHAVRGRFGGPSSSDNMFLGTAPSNNFNNASHYTQVEKPLEDYLNDEGQDETRAFDYRVTPNFDDIPQYMQNRIDDEDWVDPDDKDEFTTFANDHIPNGFRCDADLYFEDEDGDLYAKSVSEDVSTTVNADEGTEDND